MKSAVVHAAHGTSMATQEASTYIHACYHRLMTTPMLSVICRLCIQTLGNKFLRRIENIAYGNNAVAPSL